MPVFELPKKINETLEEGYKRKSDILDMIYSESMDKVENNTTNDPLCGAIATIIEFMNKLSVEEE